MEKENDFKVVKFELTPESIKIMVKEYESLELVPGDKDSYKSIHAAKMVLTKARTGTDKRRKELGADARKWIGSVNDRAKELIAPLLPVEEKLKGMLDEEDQREAKIEQARVDKIESRIKGLDNMIVAGQVYGLTSDEIRACINDVECVDLSAVDYEEKTEQAEEIKASGLEALGRILEDRVKVEEAEVEAARVKEENEAKEKELAKEREEFENARVAERERQEAEQAARDRIQKEKDDAEREAREAEEEIRRQEADELQAEREAFEKEKKELADAKQAEADRKQAEEDAAQEIINIKNAVALSWDPAHEENAAFDAAVKKKLKANKTRSKLIKSDKVKIKKTIDMIEASLLEIKPFEFDTDEATQVIADLYVKIKTCLDDAEKTGAELV